MKNLLLYYYNINTKDIIEQNNYYYIESNDNIYYLCKVKRSEDELNSIYNNTYNTKYHLIIKNKYNRYITRYNDIDYSLILVRCLLNDYISNKEIIYNRINLSNKDIDWISIWIRKIDYLDNQLKEFKVGKELLSKSFIYYSGMAECAIYYIKYHKFKSSNISICHYRVWYPNKPINYYNPFNTIIDYDVRDYAEYIKSLFFSGNIDYADKFIKELLNNNKYTLDDYGLLYGRLMFPTYYFDIFNSNILDTQVKEENLIKVIEKSNDYENFLKDIYYDIKVKYNIPEVTWLIKDVIN